LHAHSEAGVQRRNAFDALSRQLEARKIVERAKGILQRELGISEEDAYLTLQRQSRQRRKPMKEVAEAIVLSEEVRRGQQQVARGASDNTLACE
jgi:AmiR/NasT family two-component response regulator